MAIMTGGTGELAEGSGSGPDNALTDAEKDQNAANKVRACLAECIGAIHIFLPKAEKAIQDAPGTAAEIYALLGSADETEAADIGPKLRDLVNGISQLAEWSDATWNGIV